MLAAAAAAGVAVKPMAGPDHIHTGQCHCGAVTFRAEGLDEIWFCHCRQCRRITGHFLAAARTERDRYSVTGEVVWSPHSGTSQLGRCAACASPLFWQQPHGSKMSALAGCLDNTTGLAVVGHMYVSEKGDYYAIQDGLPQYATWPDENGPEGRL